MNLGVGNKDLKILYVKRLFDFLKHCKANIGFLKFLSTQIIIRIQKNIPQNDAVDLLNPYAFKLSNVVCQLHGSLQGPAKFEFPAIEVLAT